MLRLRGTLVLPLAEARRGEGQDSSGILAEESRIRVLFCEKCGRGKTRGIQGQNMAVSVLTSFRISVNFKICLPYIFYSRMSVNFKI